MHFAQVKNASNNFAFASENETVSHGTPSSRIEKQ